MPDKFAFSLKASVFLICLPTLIATAQIKTFTAQVKVDMRLPELAGEVDNYTIFALDLHAMTDFAQGDTYDDQLAIELPGYGTFALDLFHNPLKSENYQLRVQTENGVQVLEDDGIVKTFKGYVKGGQYPVRLTFDDDFINGYIKLPKDELVIESARFRQDGLPGDHILVYKASDILKTIDDFCSPQLMPKHFHNEENADEHPDERSIGDCLEIEIAFADDWLMYEERDEDAQQVEDHNMAVINNVQGNYDDEFDDELIFDVVEIFISTCSTCDPWTSSTAADAVLNSFSNWAGTGFNNGHDVASLWTDRNFNGQTVGLAWLSAVCFNNFKYNTVQDFTSNPNFLRVMLAHELGHNFGAGHDASGSGTIMAPSVNSSNSWSTASENSINNYVSGINCLGPCASSLPPEATVGSDLTEGCAPLTIQFEDLSAGSPDLWSWVFPGGSPGTSNEPNPTVTYINPGTYDVTLEVENGVGSDIITLQDYITVFPDAIPDFSYSNDELTFFFDNLSLYSDSYLWDFGDGNTSTEVDPIHTYDEDGIYDVILTATNECGDETFFVTVNAVSMPTAGLAYDQSEGCVPLTVQFESISSDNVDDYLWEFEGGDPSSSSEENPIVFYPEPGVYGVTLTVQNEAGEDMVVLPDLITVDPMPEADFTADVNGITADFENLSNNAYAYFWDFGDGTTSGEFNPTHDYSQGGEYTVMLISENDCGSDTAWLEISVNAAPIAGMSVSATSGCVPLEVQYMSTTTGDVTSYQWTFPGGSPASSTQENPLVTYNAPGSYSATLVVTNSIGTDMITMTNVVVVSPDVEADMEYDLNGQVVDFFNESSGEDNVVWVIDGDVIDEENPTVDFGADGEYEIKLIASGPCGLDSVETIINIATPPQAGLGYSGASGCEPFEVEFSDQSSDNVIAWDWSFPGGNPETSDEPNPTVVYGAPGTYSVTLVVASAGGTDEVVMDDLITVDPLPDAAFGTIQSGTEVTFENDSEHADSYLWIYGDGNTSTEESPNYDYGAFGSYEVMLIAYNNCGEDTAIISLELAGLPVPDFRAVDASGCVPFEVKFRDQSQNDPEEWEWSFPGGDPTTSTKKNPTVVYNTPGVYDVTLKVTNSAGAQAVVKEQFIEVGDLPMAEFDLAIDDEQVDFTNMSIDADSYFWDFGDGSTSEDADPVHVYPGTGTYTVTMIATNNCGSDTIVQQVMVQTSGLVLPEWDAELEIWPNPNRGQFNLQVEGNRDDLSIQIYDITGNLVYGDKLQGQGTATVNLGQDIPPGMYQVVIRGVSGFRLAKVVIQ